MIEYDKCKKALDCLKLMTEPKKLLFIKNF